MFTLLELANSVSNFGSCSYNGNPLVNRTIHYYLWEDTAFKRIDAILDPVYKEIFAKIKNYRRIGKDVTCLYEEINYLQGLSQWFILLKSKIGDCASLEDFDTFAEEMEIECIRKNLRCKYNREKLIDAIIDSLGLRTPLVGIDYMAIDDDSCQVFKID